MKTRLGNLPVYVNPTTGRAEIVRGRKRSHSAGGAPAPSPSADYDSALEAAYATILEWEHRSGEIALWMHHPLSLRLADGKRYTPDFLVHRQDGTIELIEVKGEHKNKRDSLTRLSWAAQRFRCFVFRLVWRDAHGWNGKYITP